MFQSRSSTLKMLGAAAVVVTGLVVYNYYIKDE